MSQLVRLRGKIYFTKYILCTVLQRCRAKYQLADFAKELPSPLSPPLPALLRDQIATCATELVKYKNTLHQN